jgi:hypothetical protein
LPVELLREWALLATVENNATLMDDTLKHAASMGYCLMNIFGDMSVLSVLADEVPRALAERSAPNEISVLRIHGGVNGLPPSLAGLFEITEDPCVYLEAVYNGRTVVSTTDMFAGLVAPRITLARDIELSKASPAHQLRSVPNALLITSFIHSKSTQDVEVMKLRMWKRISAESESNARGTCSGMAQDTLQVYLWHRSEGTWVETEVQAMLKVSQSSRGQASHFVLAFHVNISAANGVATIPRGSTTELPAYAPPDPAHVAAIASQEAVAYFLQDNAAAVSMEPPSIPNTSLFMKAIYDCEGEKEDELSFQVGDVIEVKHIGAADGWWVGHLVDKPERCGLFPSSYTITKLNCISRTTSAATASTSSSSNFIEHASTSSETNSPSRATFCSISDLIFKRRRLTSDLA